MMTLLSEVKGWSPVIHSLARQRDIGLVTAAVYGAVWRYCQMESRVCTASLETIGDDLGIDKATVLRHIKKLCDKGYLKDETPGLRNVPHTYSDAGKVKINGVIEAGTVAHDNTSLKTVAHSNTLLSKSVAHDNTFTQTVAHSNATVAHSNATVAHSNATVAESQLNRVSKRLFKESESHAPDKILKKNKELAIKLTQVCGYTGPEFVVNGRLKDCAEATAQLAEWHATVDDLDQFARYWWGQTPPTFRQVVEEWGKFLASRNQSPDHPDAYQPPALDDGKLAAYKQQLEADRVAEAESASRVSEIMDKAHVFGIDVQREIRKTIRRIKK